MEKKVKIAIRDDDANFFTKPSDLIKVYKEIPDFPISFAIIPYVVEAGACPDVEINNKKPCFIGDNKELVGFFEKSFKEGRCDILMHGITHEYKYYGERKIAEMLWRSNETGEHLGEQLMQAKQLLEDVLKIPLQCFVAPHNDIDKAGIEALPKGMDYSGIIAIKYNRCFDLMGIKNYVKRIWCRFRYGIPYPGVLCYNGHKELNACSVRDYEFLMKVYKYCKLHGHPMVINVHYWHIRDYPEKYNDFFKFINYAIQDGALPSRVRDCF